MPLELSHLWDWFVELSAGRGSNGWGPNPISYPDIAAWAGLTGVAIRVSEVRALIWLDRLWLQSHNEGQKAHQAWLADQRRRAHGR
jgi:hypothetical protein